MTYLLGKLIWGIPIILLAASIEFAVRRAMPKRPGAAGWVQERRVGTVTAAVTLIIVSVIYFLTKSE
jgi:hypothetical protein